MSLSLSRSISKPKLASPYKYGWLCEWDRHIYGRHYTFRIDGSWVVVTKWDKKDLWVESERWFQVLNAYVLFMQKFDIAYDLRYQRERAIAWIQAELMLESV